MNYLLLLPLLVLGMLAFMFWYAVFRLRRDRLKHERMADRSQVIFAPRQRARFLLSRSFRVEEDRPEWEEPLISNLAAVEPVAKSVSQP